MGLKLGRQLGLGLRQFCAKKRRRWVELDNVIMSPLAKKKAIKSYIKVRLPLDEGARHFMGNYTDCLRFPQIIGLYATNTY